MPLMTGQDYIESVRRLKMCVVHVRRRGRRSGRQPDSEAFPELREDDLRPCAAAGV